MTGAIAPLSLGSQVVVDATLGFRGFFFGRPGFAFVIPRGLVMLHFVSVVTEYDGWERDGACRRGRRLGFRDGQFDISRK
jgi:hypothetical protein